MLWSDIKESLKVEKKVERSNQHVCENSQTKFYEMQIRTFMRPRIVLRNPSQGPHGYLSDGHGDCEVFLTRGSCSPLDLKTQWVTHCGRVGG